MKFINCIGDSLTFGARDEKHRSYPAELSKLFWDNETESIYCINNGISGETSGELLKRIYSNCKSCIEAKVGLLIIGTNDTVIHTPPDIYFDNVRQILLVMKYFYTSVGIGFLPPVYGPGLSIYPIDSQKQIDNFNNIIEAELKLFYDFSADFRKMHSYIIDTVHFSNSGYIEMANIWYDCMKQNRITI